jgi:hypothetical protein
VALDASAKVRHLEIPWQSCFSCRFNSATTTLPTVLTSSNVERRIYG